MFQTMRKSPSFRAFVLWVALILLIVLAVWVWSKRAKATQKPAANPDAATGTQAGPEGEVDSNNTFVINQTNLSGPTSPSQPNRYAAPGGGLIHTGQNTTDTPSGSTTPPVGVGGALPIRRSGGPTPARRMVASAPVRNNRFVTVASWHPGSTPWNTTLWGIASHYNTTVTHLLSLPYNAKYRGRPNDLHSGEQVQVG